jgi:hypothetical protein
MSDVITGAKALTKYINDEILAEGEQWSESKVYHLIEAGHLPVGRLGSQIIASKGLVRERIMRLVAGE